MSAPAPDLPSPPDLPGVEDVLAALEVVRLPLAVRFRGVTEREVALVHGPAGWGEFAPFPEYGPPEAARWLAAAIDTAWRPWPAPLRETVPVNATVPAVAPGQVAGVLARYDGTTTAKVKVAEPGQTLADDLARVAEVRRVLGPGGRIRVDANGGWGVEQALDALTRLAPYDLEYAEQPVAHVPGLRALRLALARAGVDVPVAADESIRKAEDPLEVARQEAADLVVVKVAPLGGVHAALAVVAACGLPAVVSSALDSSIGLQAGVALAAALPRLEHACGLGTARLLTDDVVADPLSPARGALPVVGARLAPDPALLARHRVPAPRRAWWEQRVRDAHAVLATTPGAG